MRGEACGLIYSVTILCVILVCTTQSFGGLDHLVFLAGIGEHNATIRSKVCGKLAHMGIWIDEEKNQAVGNEAACISKDDSPVTSRSDSG